jgi:hypothetical protein
MQALDPAAAQRRQGPRAPACHVTVIRVTLDILLP